MESQEIQKAITAIEYEWENLSQEPDNDPEYFHFISVKSTALKMKIHNLLHLLKEQIDTDKESKLAFQKLFASLEKMEASLDSKMKITKDLNHEHIKSVLSKIKGLEPEITVIREYITD